MSSSPGRRLTAPLLLAAVLVGLGAALLEGLHAQHASGAGSLAALSWLAASVLMPLALVMAIGLRVLLAAANWDLMPSALARQALTWLRLSGPGGRDKSAQLLAVVAIALGMVAVQFVVAQFFMTRFHNLTLAALVLAVGLLVPWALVVVCWRGLVGLITWKLNLLGKLGPLGRALHRPLTWVALMAITAIAALVWASAKFEQTIEAIRFGVLVVPAVMLLMIWLLADILRRTRMTGSWVVVLPLMALSVFPAVREGMRRQSVPAVDEAANALSEHAWFARVPLEVARGLTDRDHDGLAVAFGGGDCDDGNPNAYPGAAEEPANGVDEDCSGSDLVIDADLLATLNPDEESHPGEGSGERADDGQDGTGEGTGATLTDPVAAYQRSWNVVLITVDTLRPDHLGYAGYERTDISPTIDALAARSVRFATAYAPSAKTPTSVPPMLASRWPSEMPRDFRHFVHYEEDANLFFPEVLTEAGYHTAASLSHWYFQHEYGFADGFTDWRSYFIVGDNRMESVPSSEEVADNAIAILDEYYTQRTQAPEETPPLFLWMHFFDPHKLYIDHDEIEAYGTRQVDRYDGEIRFVDMQLARVMQVLQDNGATDDTVIIFTSDHGEAFGEHDMRHHGWDLYEHQIRVPLLISVPGIAPRDVTQRVSIMDLAPTIVDLTGETIPEEFRGHSLLPALALGEEPPERPIFTEMPPGPYNSLKRSLTLGDWKLIYHASGNQMRLFNLADDPGELHDLWEEEPDQAERMQAAYELFMATQIDPVRADGEGRSGSNDDEDEDEEDRGTRESSGP